MQIFEFHSVVDEQGMIRIPDEYRNRIHSSVKVIVLTDNPAVSDRASGFTALQIPTKGYSFNREEANAR